MLYGQADVVGTLRKVGRNEPCGELRKRRLPLAMLAISRSKP